MNKNNLSYKYIYMCILFMYFMYTLYVYTSSNSLFIKKIIAYKLISIKLFIKLFINSFIFQY